MAPAAVEDEAAPIAMPFVAVAETLDCPPMAMELTAAACAPKVELPPIATEPLPEAVTAAAAVPGPPTPSARP